MMATDFQKTGFTPLQGHALRRFADQGFNATKLAHIAADAGIKPPSIYAHFKSKEELYMSLLPPAIEHELAVTGEALRGTERRLLYDFLRDTGERFVKTHHLRFLVRASYLPPAELTVETDRYISPFCARQKDIIRKCIDLLPPSRLPPEQLATAYQGLVDSLQTTILYMGKSEFENRLEALWAIFSLGLEEE